MILDLGCVPHACLRMGGALDLVGGGDTRRSAAAGLLPEATACACSGTLNVKPRGRGGRDELPRVMEWSWRHRGEMLRDGVVCNVDVKCTLQNARRKGRGHGRWRSSGGEFAGGGGSGPAGNSHCVAVKDVTAALRFATHLRGAVCNGTTDSRGGWSLQLVIRDQAVAHVLLDVALSHITLFQARFKLVTCVFHVA